MNRSKVLVTGGAGFIGSHLCERILSLGHQVVCYDNLSTGYFENIQHLITNESFTLIVGDIQEVSRLREAMRDCTHVTHQAALGSVPRSIKDPYTTDGNNTRGTLNVFQVASELGISKVVYASSSSVYGDTPVSPKVEGHEGDVLSPYAVTKQTSEKYAKVYHHLHGLETIGLRYFNVFGPRQSPNGAYAAVIPIFVSKVLNSESVPINGDGLQTRDFTFIENVIDANMRSLFSSKDSASGNAHNIACGRSFSVLEIYEMIKKSVDELRPDNLSSSNPVHRADRAGDVRDSLADLSLSNRNLGYAPLVHTEEGITKTVSWFLKSTGGDSES